MNELTVIRKTTIFYAVDNGLASVERALVDLYYEVTRARYPLDTAELIRIWYNALTTVSLEFPKMLRYAGLRRFRSEIEWVLWSFKDRIDIPETYIKKQIHSPASPHWRGNALMKIEKLLPSNLIVPAESFSANRLAKNAQELGYAQAETLEALVWDYELYAQLQQRISGSCRLKGGAAVQLYPPTRQR